MNVFFLLAGILLLVISIAHAMWGEKSEERRAKRGVIRFRVSGCG